MSFQVKSSNMQMKQNSVNVRARPIIRVKIAKKKTSSDSDESVKKTLQLPRPKQLRGMISHNNHHSKAENFF
jgi:hypothetical protein